VSRKWEEMFRDEGKLWEIKNKTIQVDSQSEVTHHRRRADKSAEQQPRTSDFNLRIESAS
jgi:hypothetical protein